MADDVEENPWNVAHVEDFLYFCCPQCNDRKQSKELFLQHAFTEHSTDISKSSLGLRLKKKEVDIKQEQIDISDNDGDNEEDLDDENHVEVTPIKTEPRVIIDEPIDYSDHPANDLIPTEDIKNESGGHIADHFLAATISSSIPNQHDCERCEGVTFSKLCDLKQHYESDHPGEFQHCDKCYHSFLDKDALDEHVKNEHEGNFQCKSCSKTFYSVPSLMNHVAQYHRGIPMTRNYQCGHCTKSFFTNEKLKIHIAKSHGPQDGNQKTYECGICHSMFDKILKLNDHVKKSHTQEELEQLKVQMKAAKTKAPKEKVKEELSCEYCGKTFLQSVGLRTHIKNFHEGQKDEFSCEFCGKKFGYKDNMMMHIKSVHEKTRNYLCVQCGKHFIYPQSLRSHIRKVHDLIRSPPCEYCQKVFSKNSDLRHHIDVVHKGIKTHVCDMCGKALATSNHLKRHYMQVHKLDITINKT